METLSTFRTKDSKENALQLAKKLQNYLDHPSVIVDTTCEKNELATQLAHTLALPLEVRGCAYIKHPADPHRSLGSVSIEEVYLHHHEEDLPQDFVAHQILLQRNALRKRVLASPLPIQPTTLQNKTAIIAIDYLYHIDQVGAAVESIRKENPHHLLIAASRIGQQDLLSLTLEVDAILFLEIEMFRW